MSADARIVRQSGLGVRLAVGAVEGWGNDSSDRGRKKEMLLLLAIGRPEFHAC